MAAYHVAECRWFLDRPVSNSGRLKGIIEELGASRGWPWGVELVADPDAVLADAGVGAAVQLPSQPGQLSPQPGQLPVRPGVVVATADSAILARSAAWFNLAREVVTQHVPAAWVVELDA